MPFKGRIVSWSAEGRIKFRLPAADYEYLVDGAWLTNAMRKYTRAPGKLFADVKARAHKWRKDAGEWQDR